MLLLDQSVKRQMCDEEEHEKGKNKQAIIRQVEKNQWK